MKMMKMTEMNKINNYSILYFLFYLKSYYISNSAEKYLEELEENCLY